MKRFLNFPGRRAERGDVVLGYGLAVLLVLLATVARWLLDPFVGESVPYVTYFLASAVAIRFTGLGPSILAMVLGALAAAWYFVPPRGAMPTHPAHLLSIGVFLAANLIVLALAQAMRRAKGQAETNAQIAVERQKGLERLLAEREQAQHKLRDQAALLDLAPVLGRNLDDQIILWGQGAEGLYGFSQAEALGRVSHELLKTQFPQPLDQIRAELMSRGNWQGELIHQSKEGMTRVVLSQWVLHRDTQGQPIAILETNRDITERKQVEAALNASEQRLRLAQQIACIGTFEWNIQTGVNTWTPELETLYGLPPGGFSGTQSAWENLVHPDDRARAVQLVERAFETGMPAEGEWRVAWPDGSLHWLAGRWQVFRDAAGQPLRMTGVNIDITARKQAEAALRESERQFRALADSIPNLAWWANSDGYITWYNQRWYEYTGTTPEQMKGWGWQSVHDPELLPQVLERWRGSIATGEPFEMEFPLRGANGRFRWFLTRVMPVRDAQGKVVRWFGTNTDVTEQREVREVLARSNEELESKVQERTVKLRELVGELEHFSYTITHDIRSPLRAMQAFAQLMLETSCADCANRISTDYLKRIMTAAGRMDALITDALNYSKVVRTELTLEPVDVGALLHDMLDTYPNLQPPNAEISLAGEFPPVLGNAAALTQCFSNLLGNAVKFVAPGTRPRVRIWAETRDDCVRLWFEDNGIGIPQEYQAHIFDMFYRGERTYEGTGIGLALVRKNTERMGGKVGVESEPGKGSRFWLELQKGNYGPLV